MCTSPIKSNPIRIYQAKLLMGNFKVYKIVHQLYFCTIVHQKSGRFLCTWYFKKAYRGLQVRVPRNLNVNNQPCFEDKSSSLTLKYQPEHFSEISCICRGLGPRFEVLYYCLFYFKENLYKKN